MNILSYKEERIFLCASDIPSWLAPHFYRLPSVRCCCLCEEFAVIERRTKRVLIPLVTRTFVGVDSVKEDGSAPDDHDVFRQFIYSSGSYSYNGDTPFYRYTEVVSDAIFDLHIYDGWGFNEVYVAGLVSQSNFRSSTYTLVTEPSRVLRPRRLEFESWCPYDPALFEKFDSFFRSHKVTLLKESP